MPIITISHPAFGNGRAVAERVAAILDCRCVSREVLLEASNRYGIPKAKLFEVLETEPRWWERWMESLRVYRITLQAAMCEVVQGGRIVYHGRAGQELLPGISHVLKVFLDAPVAQRVGRLKARQGLSDETARGFLKEADRTRAHRLKAIFGIDWRDSARYDLLLNSARIGVESAAQLIVEASQREEFQPTPESEQAFVDLTTASTVQATLVTSPGTRGLHIDVAVENGVVRLTGVLPEPALETEILRIVEGIPGVAKVAAKFVMAPIQDFMFP